MRKLLAHRCLPAVLALAVLAASTALSAGAELLVSTHADNNRHGAAVHRHRKAHHRRKKTKHHRRHKKPATTKAPALAPPPPLPPPYAAPAAAPSLTAAAPILSASMSPTLPGGPPPSLAVDKALPTISGITMAGQTLTTTYGEWEGDPTSYEYQWQDCDTTGTACEKIASATSSTHTLAGSDVGHTLRATVTAVNAGGSTPATSTQTAVVTKPSEPPPACTSTVSETTNLAGALSEARAGAAICLSGGSYGALTLDNIKPPGNVTLEPVEGATVTIDGIEMQLDSNLTIKGFQLSGGVSVTQGASNLTFQDNHTSNTECGYLFYGWPGYSISHIQVLENTMEHLNFSGAEEVCSGAGVVFIGTVSNFTIDDNTIGPDIADHYTQTGGIENLQEDGNTFLGPSLRYEHDAGEEENDHQNILQIFGESSNVEFSNNIMRNTGTNAGSLLFQEGQMKNVKVDNNLFDHDADGYSVQIYPVEGLEFTHNTVVGSHWGVYFRKAEEPDQSYGDDYNVTDNIFVENDKSGETPDIAEEGCSSNCDFDYNVSSDDSAEGAHSIRNWTPQWLNTTFYLPLDIPFEAGYRQG
jgi:hypothetical protein